MKKKWFKVHRNGLRNKASWCFYCIVWFCLGVSLHAQESYFRAIGGVPHLPVVDNSEMIGIFPLRSGMMVYNSERVMPMLYTGSSWESLCDASGFSVNGNAGYFQVVDGISVFSVNDFPPDPLINGEMAITSTLNNSTRILRVYVSGVGWTDIESLDGIEIGLNPNLHTESEFTSPVSTSDPSPTGFSLSAGAFYINATDAVFKWYDGSAWHELNCGCFAYTNPEKTTILEFMCHNLGADTSLDPFTWQSNSSGTTSADLNSFDIKGSLYQWGRPTDGHQLRNSLDLGLYLSPTNGLHFFVKTAEGEGQPKDDWQTPHVNRAWFVQKTPTDPCPSGYRVPSIAQWRSIFGSSMGPAEPSGDATNNVWTWTGHGYTIGRSAEVYSLYLPAAGQRDYNGAVTHTGRYGVYWSATSYGASAPPANGVVTQSHYIYMNEDNVTTGYGRNRQNGLSVRCVVYEYE